MSELQGVWGCGAEPGGVGWSSTWFVGLCSVLLLFPQSPAALPMARTAFFSVLSDSQPPASHAPSAQTAIVQWMRQ